MTKVKINKDYTFEILVLRICIELRSSLVDNSIHTEQVYYGRLISWKAGVA